MVRVNIYPNYEPTGKGFRPVIRSLAPTGEFRWNHPRELSSVHDAIVFAEEEIARLRVVGRIGEEWVKE